MGKQYNAKSTKKVSSPEKIYLERRGRKTEQVTPLVVGFHPNLPNLTCILHNHHCVINTSPQFSGAIPKPPPPPPPQLPIVACLTLGISH